MNEVQFSLHELLFKSMWYELSRKLEDDYQVIMRGLNVLAQTEESLLDVCVAVAKVLHLVDSLDIMKRIFVSSTGIIAIAGTSDRVSGNSANPAESCWIRFNEALEARWYDIHFIQRGCVDDWDSLRFFIRCTTLFAFPLATSNLHRAVQELIPVSSVNLMQSYHFNVIIKDLIQNLTKTETGLAVLTHLFQQGLFMATTTLQSIEKTLFTTTLFAEKPNQAHRIASQLDPASDGHILLISRLSKDGRTCQVPYSPIVAALTTHHPSLELAIACFRAIDSPLTLSPFPLLQSELSQFSELLGGLLATISTNRQPDLTRDLIQVVRPFPSMLLSLIRGARSKKITDSTIRLQLLQTVIDTFPSSTDKDFVQSVCWLAERLTTHPKEPERNFAVFLCLPWSEPPLSPHFETVLNIPILNDTIRRNCANCITQYLSADAAPLLEDEFFPKLLQRTIEVAESFSLVLQFLKNNSQSVPPREIVKVIVSADKEGRWWTALVEQTDLIPQLVKTESLNDSRDLVAKIPELNRLLSFPQRLDILACIQRRGEKKFHSSRL